MIDVKAHYRNGVFVPAHRRRPPARNQDRMLSVRLSKETFDNIRHLAEDRNGMTMSEFVRSLLDRL